MGMKEGESAGGELVVPYNRRSFSVYVVGARNSPSGDENREDWIYADDAVHKLPGARMRFQIATLLPIR
jgi:hypothetical protein